MSPGNESWAAASDLAGMFSCSTGDGSFFATCFEKGLLVRYTGDTIALSPPLIITPEQIETIFATLRHVLAEVK